ncbi:MAG: thiol-disulfide oxidoreductase DCC family protein [Bacteroidota bacterium]|nr:thiol-disulfide oxidoreductase DCC family protein [Bacteroidota bacterium]
MQDQPIILFDGVCNLCNGAVNFVIRRDKKSVLKFATLQSETAHQLLSTHHLRSTDLESFVFIENNSVDTRSTAALKVCRYLNGLWPLMYGFMIVPKFLRDIIYNWISKNRYEWFGKKEECMIPSPDIEARFLNKTT